MGGNMSKRRPSHMRARCLLGVLFLVGCGGDDDTGSSPRAMAEAYLSNVRPFAREILLEVVPTFLPDRPGSVGPLGCDLGGLLSAECLPGGLVNFLFGDCRFERDGAQMVLDGAVSLAGAAEDCLDARLDPSSVSYTVQSLYVGIFHSGAATELTIGGDYSARVESDGTFVWSEFAGFRGGCAGDGRTLVQAFESTVFPAGEECPVAGLLTVSTSNDLGTTDGLVTVSFTDPGGVEIDDGGAVTRYDDCSEIQSPICGDLPR